MRTTRSNHGLTGILGSDFTRTQPQLSRGWPILESGTKKWSGLSRTLHISVSRWRDRSRLRLLHFELDLLQDARFLRHLGSTGRELVGVEDEREDVHVLLTAQRARR